MIKVNLSRVNNACKDLMSSYAEKVKAIDTMINEKTMVSDALVGINGELKMFILFI